MKVNRNIKRSGAGSPMLTEESKVSELTEATVIGRGFKPIIATDHASSLVTFGSSGVSGGTAQYKSGVAKMLGARTRNVVQSKTINTFHSSKTSTQ